MIKKLFLLILIGSLFAFTDCRVLCVRPSHHIYCKEGVHKILYGFVEVKSNDIYVVVNPDCKCRESYKVVGDKVEDLKKLNGMSVEVEGCLKRFSPWSGEIYVKNIFRLE